MRIPIDPLLPTDPRASDEWLKVFRFKLDDYLRKLSTQLNALTEGRISAATNAYTAAPTTGTWAKGDYIKNSSPTEAGTAGSKYVIQGWVCSVSGTPGTWLQCRTLTGN